MSEHSNLFKKQIMRFLFKNVFLYVLTINFWRDIKESFLFREILLPFGVTQVTPNGLSLVKYHKKINNDMHFVFFMTREGSI